MARISIQQKTLFIVLLAVIVLSIGIIAYKFSGPKPVTSYNYYGIPMNFRADLRQADNVSVYPDDLTIYNTIWNEKNENLTIVFVNSSDNSLVIIEAFEITFKLKLAFGLFNFPVNITGMEIGSYSNISTDENHPIIALIPPSLANDTVVGLKDNVVFIEGKTKQEFDLATVKFLMSALDIKVD